jgi:hypothetical protein
MPEAVGEAERLHPVEQAEVDHLGGPPLVGLHLLERQTPDSRRGRGVNVNFVLEGIDEEGSPLMWARIRSSIWE